MRKRQKLPKTRNAGTMTEPEFWQMIRSALRQKSRWWKPISEAKNNHRRPYKGPNKRQKWEYQCAHCTKWHKGDNIEVHHIVAVGSLTCGKDLEGFVDRLFTEKGFHVLCKPCHKKLHKKIKNDEGKANRSLQNRKQSKR